jgi:Fe2+ or Zn2+ uptake regulation protein
MDTILQGIKAGDIEGSKSALVTLLGKNPKIVNAWALLANLSENPSRKIDCYKQILSIDPDNRHAAEKLRALSKSPSKPKKTDSAMLCPQCGGAMEVRFIGEMRDKRAFCQYCNTVVDLPDSFQQVKRTQEKKKRFGSSSTVTTTVVETRRDGQISPKNAESLPPKIKEIMQILKEQGAEALTPELLQKIQESGTNLSFSSEAFGENALQALKKRGFDIDDDLPLMFSSKSIITKAKFGDMKDEKSADLSPERIIELAGGALPEEDRQKCPNPACRAVIPKGAKKCSWCGEVL